MYFKFLKLDFAKKREAVCWGICLNFITMSAVKYVKILLQQMKLFIAIFKKEIKLKG
jgi:hypothetical protein